VNNLIDLALEKQISHFLVGMALGTDQVFAERLSARKIPWTAVVPCRTQANPWPKRQQMHYKKLLENASKQVVLFEEYSRGVMQSRNLYMVRHSVLCLAVYDGRLTGGTHHAINAAKGRMDIVVFNPSKSSFRLIPGPTQLSLFQHTNAQV